MLVGSDVAGEGDHVDSGNDVDAVVVGVGQDAAGTDLVGGQGTVTCPSKVAGHATATPGKARLTVVWSCGGVKQIRDKMVCSGVVLCS